MIDQYFLHSKSKFIIPVYKDNNWDPEIVALVDKWSLLEMPFYALKAQKGTSKWSSCG